MNFTNGIYNIKLDPVQTQIVNSDGSQEVFENGLHYYFKGTNSNLVTLIDSVKNHTEWSEGECHFTELSNLDGSNLVRHVDCQNGSNTYSQQQQHQSIDKDTDLYYYNWESKNGAEI